MLHLQIKFGCNWTSTFQPKKKKKKKPIPILHFSSNLTSDDPWPWYMTFDLINMQRNLHCIFDLCLVPIGIQLFKGDPNNENQHFPPNLTSDDSWPWYVTFDLINIWRNPYCISDPSLVVFGLQLFKVDPNNENLTGTHIHTHPYTHRQICYRNIPYCFSSQDDSWDYIFGEPGLVMNYS